MQISIHSVAGRHAADQQRATNDIEARALLTHQRFEACEVLVALLCKQGLAVKAELSPLHGDPVVGVALRDVDRWQIQRELAYASLDAEAWHVLTSRSSERVDTLELMHQGTGARLRIVLQLPKAAPDHYEAA